MAAGIINFVVLTAAASATNSSLFTTGRMLFSLNYHGKSKFARKMSTLSRTQVPANGLIFSAMVIAISVIANFIIPNTSLFNFVSSVATTCFLFIWGAIVVAHIKYRKSLSTQAEQKLTFKMPLYPLSNYLVLAFLVFIAVVLCLEKTTLYALIAAIIWFIALYVAIRMRHRENN